MSILWELVEWNRRDGLRTRLRFLWSVISLPIKGKRNKYIKELVRGYEVGCGIGSDPFSEEKALARLFI